MCVDKVGFFEVVTPLGGAQCLFARRKFVLAFVSGPISSIKSFTDSQNYALSGYMQFYTVKREQVGAVTPKYDAA